MAHDLSTVVDMGGCDSRWPRTARDRTGRADDGVADPARARHAGRGTSLAQEQRDSVDAPNRYVLLRRTAGGSVRRTVGRRRLSLRAMPTPYRIGIRGRSLFPRGQRSRHGPAHGLYAPWPERAQPSFPLLSGLRQHRVLGRGIQTRAYRHRRRLLRRPDLSSTDGLGMGAIEAPLGRILLRTAPACATAVLMATVLAAAHRSRRA